MDCFIFFSLLLILSVFAQDNDDNGEIIIETPMGFIKGTEFPNALNGTFFAFMAIPFAKPPLGPLRFMPPEPAEPWEGVFDATEEGPKCSQIDVHSQTKVGQEDCLKIDVFTPKHPNELKKKPIAVMVIFHCGAFHFGHYSIESAGPDFLLSHDVIVVFVRYRLNVFGFLSFQDDILPGNAGMKDQLLALKWIRNNIGAFGGNPDLVTISGMSAGGISAHLHMMSKASRGLFHRVIASSGTALIPHVPISHYPKENAKILGDVYNCSRDGNLALLKCLQAVASEDLAVSQYNAVLMERRNIDMDIGFFTPCIEPDHENAFLSDDPYELLARGEMADVPFLAGTVDSETAILESALSFTMIPLQDRQKIITEFKENHEKLLWRRKPYVGTERMAKEAIKHYFKDEEPSLENLDLLNEYLTDYAFFMPTWDSLTLHLRSKKSPAFHYLFRHDTDFSIMRQKSFLPIKGVAHGDFYHGYILYNSANSVDPNHEAYQTFQRASKFWTNFAIYGDPTPDDSMGIKWLPTELKNRYYLDFDKEVSLKKDANFENVRFWLEQRQKENFTI